MKYFHLVTALLLCNSVFSQVTPEKDSVIHHLELRSGLLIASNERVPYWMSANNSQRFRTDDASQIYSNILLYKNPRTDRYIDFGYGLELAANFNGAPNARLIQGYATLNINDIQITAGKREEVWGIGNRRLGFGDLLNGANASPIPKVSIGTNGWKEAPFLKNYITYRAHISHGWFEKDRFQSEAFLHQKFMHVNLHPKSKAFELIFGLTHNAQWGGYNLDNESEQPTGLGNYLRILTAGGGAGDADPNDQINALGNHLGTWDIKGAIKIGNWKLSNYWQFLWEDRSGLTPYNWRDGMVGLSLEKQGERSLIDAFNVEVIRTNEQDAEKTGDDGSYIFEPDNFLNNGIYKSGWTYNSVVMGSPVFLLLNPESHTISRIKNMVNGLSAGVSGRFEDIDYSVVYRKFTNAGTRKEVIDPKLRVESILLELQLFEGPANFVFQAEYNWSNYLGKNLGVRIEYQFDLSQLLKKPGKRNWAGW